jgi:hypothetical protein
MIVINFIRDAEVGIFARAKRIGPTLSTKLSKAPLAACNAATSSAVESDGSESDSKKNN